MVYLVIAKIMFGGGYAIVTMGLYPTRIECLDAQKIHTAYHHYIPDGVTFANCMSDADYQAASKMWAKHRTPL